MWQECPLSNHVLSDSVLSRSSCLECSICLCFWYGSAFAAYEERDEEENGYTQLPVSTQAPIPAIPPITKVMPPSSQNFLTGFPWLKLKSRPWYISRVFLEFQIGGQQLSCAVLAFLNIFYCWNRTSSLSPLGSGSMMTWPLVMSLENPFPSKMGQGMRNGVWLHHLLRPPVTWQVLKNIMCPMIYIYS